MTEAHDGPKEVRRKREFKSGFTKEFLFLFCLDLGIAGLMLNTGIHLNNFRPGWQHRGDVFIGLGIIIAMCAVALALTVRGKTVIITTDAFHYRKGAQKDLVVTWPRLCTFAPSPAEKKWFRSAVIGDGSRNVHVDSLYFKDYDLIVKLIQTLKTRNSEVPQ
jgi:hypothetical protein